MWSDYFFYLMSLSENERDVQVSIIIISWFVLIILGVTIEYIKKSYFDKKKDD